MNKEKLILLIDDDSRNIFALSAVLKSKGFNTIAAQGMQDAFGILESNKAISLILMDMMMPDMDGYEAAAKLKRSELFQHIPIIAVTAQAMPGDRQRSLNAGADDYLSKPVDIDQLLHLLSHYLK